MNGYYKTLSGKIFPLEKQDAIDVSNKDIIELVLPEGCKKVFCYVNKLIELVIPEGCKRVHCSNNQLTNLVVAEGCVEIYCHHNQLTEFNPPKSCKVLWCDIRAMGDLSNNIEELELFNG
jgi:hypothetical protein